MKSNKNLKSFVKWAGGKTKLLPELLKRVPDSFDTYYEPFVGGGALLFALQPDAFIITDANNELINAYNIIKHNVQALIEQLQSYRNTKNFYYQIRQESKTLNITKDVKRAANFLFLNKTCFNGLYRVNKKGEFNVPFGNYKNPNFINSEVLKLVSYFLSNRISIINCNHYLDDTLYTGKNDFVYFDPPYYKIKKTSFTSYTNNDFTEQDHIELRDECIRLNSIGAKFLLSNSDTEFTRELYKNFNIDTVYAGRSINSDGTGRGKVSEILVKNY